MDWDVPFYIRDKEIHSLLEKKGYNKTRSDREWFSIPDKDPIRLLHEIILELENEYKNTSAQIKIGDQNWLKQYEIEKNKESKDYIANQKDQIRVVLRYQHQWYFEVFKNECETTKNITRSIEVLDALKNNYVVLSNHFSNLNPEDRHWYSKHMSYQKCIDEVEQFIRSITPEEKTQEKSEKISLEKKPSWIGYILYSLTIIWCVVLAVSMKEYMLIGIVLGYFQFSGIKYIVEKDFSIEVPKKRITKSPYVHDNDFGKFYQKLYKDRHMK
jgi:hypothetical protein